jgi:predicted nucleotide-binding protein
LSGGEATTVNTSNPELFASYAQADLGVVEPLVEAIRQQGVGVWLAHENLTPGAQWPEQIAAALDGASGLLVFVSSASVASRHLLGEIDYFLKKNKRLVFPVLLEDDALDNYVGALDYYLSDLQYYGLTEPRNPQQYESVAKRIAGAVLQAGVHSKEENLPALEQKTELALELAANARRQSSISVDKASPPHSVFIVHGHDDEFLRDVESFLTECNVKSVVLRKIGGASQSLFQKFMQWGSDTRFAIVLLTGDDLGASRVQYETEGVADRALQFRARQNVVLELGFFYGHLGWENVFVLYKPPNRIFPNFERPSDLDGVVFDAVDGSEQWRDYLRAKLLEAGFVIG